MWKREAAELVDPHRLIPDDPNLVEEIATLYATEVALKASQKKLETADLAVRRTVQLCICNRYTTFRAGLNRVLACVHAFFLAAPIFWFLFGALLFGFLLKPRTLFVLCPPSIGDTKEALPWR